MSKPVVGKKLDNNKVYTRDAIHVPIIPVKAGEFLVGGDFVCIKDGYAYEVDFDDATGIIDPWLNPDEFMERDEQVYVFLKPGSVTKLWHDWTHPKLDKKK